MLITDFTLASLQTSALDRSLAFSEAIQANQDLAIQTAGASVQGLLTALDETGVFGQAMNAASEAMQLLYTAEEVAKSDPFEAASEAERQQHLQTVLDGLRTQAQQLQAAISAAQASANNALGNTQADTPERAAAQAVKNAADALHAANETLKNGDTSLVDSALQAAQNAQSTAQTALSNVLLEDDPPASSARIAAAQEVLAAANQTLSSAQKVADLKSSPIGSIMGEIQTAHDLGNGYTLSTWGDSGIWTLVGPDGAGIIVKPDGTVDPLDGSGEGWKFGATSTFVLPGDIKITVNPGSPASLLVTKGINQLNIDGLREGGDPHTSDYKKNGRQADEQNNDGHIFTIGGGGTSNWNLNGQPLGDASNREVVATSAVINELKLDPTDVAISTELRDFFILIGYTPQDYDGDGKLNDVELVAVAEYVNGYITGLQEAFSQALIRIAQANSALQELTTFLETLRHQNDRSELSKDQTTAEEKAVLTDIEKKLVAAFAALKGSEPSATQPTGEATFSTASAETLLARLNQFTRQDSTLPATTPATNTAPPSGTPSQESSLPDGMGQALRRAERLLSGLGNFDFAALSSLLPPTAQEAGVAPVIGEPAAPASTQTSLPGVEDLAGGLQNLESLLISAGLLGPLGESTPAQPVSLADLTAGIGGLFNFLADSGIFGDTPLAGVEPQDLLTALAGLTSFEDSPALVTQEQLRELAPALLALVGAFAEFGAAQQARLPATVPGEPAPVAQGSLAPRTALSQELQEVLSGLAALATPGHSQSSSSNTLPTAEQLTLGAQNLLAALAALDAFGPTDQPGEGQNNITGLNFGSTVTFNVPEEINTITQNFYTDPKLMERLQENYRKSQQVYAEQLKQAKDLFTQAQETVQDFVSLIKEDDLVKEIVTSDDLSDEQQDAFAERMTELRKDWGVEWGSSGTGTGTPAEQGSLVSKVVQSGMMV